MDHALTIAHVNGRYNGNWTIFIESWVAHRKKMQDIHDRNSTAVIPNLGYTLEGPQLSEYIRRIDLRISAKQCLAQGAAMAAARKSVVSASPTREAN